MSRPRSLTYHELVPVTPPPPGFENSRPASPDDLHALPQPSHAAAHTLEQCIASHHVAEVDYTDEAGHRSTITIKPAFIRFSTAGHVVLWGIPTNAEHWEELRLDRINSVRDTGKEFTPTW